MNGIPVYLVNSFSIPPVGNLSHVLLNFVLNEFDNEIEKLCPSLIYTRYVHDIYISCAKNDCCLSGCIDNTIQKIFNKLSLKGKIQTLEVGDEPVRCLGGHIGMNNDKTIVFSSYKESGLGGQT